MIIKENVKNIYLKWIYIITGTFLMAIAYKSIYYSAGMVTGGISGISIIIRRLSLIAKESWKSGWLPQSGIPIWLTNIMLDIPLFIWAYCKKGIDYIKDTLAADVLLTFYGSTSSGYKSRCKLFKDCHNWRHNGRCWYWNGIKD